jgi:hypothetical protein
VVEVEMSVAVGGDLVGAGRWRDSFALIEYQVGVLV